MGQSAPKIHNHLQFHGLFCSLHFKTQRPKVAQYRKTEPRADSLSILTGPGQKSISDEFADGIKISQDQLKQPIAGTTPG